MKRLLLLAAIFLVAHSGIFAQFGTVWQRTSANGNLPTWFGADTERGMTYGVVGGKERVYVTSRNSGTFVRILDALTGEDVKKADGVSDSLLNVTGIAGGTYTINDIEVSADGKIFATNLTTNVATSALKIYMWANENAAPVNIVSFTDASLTSARFGDRFTVTGSLSDNSFALYAVSNTGKLLKVTTKDNGATFITEIRTLGGITGTLTQPSITPLPDSKYFYFNASNVAAIRIDSTNWAAVDSIKSTVIDLKSNAVKAFTSAGKTYIASSIYDYGNVANYYYKAVIVDVTEGAKKAALIGALPNTGNVRSTTGAGDVSIKDNGDGTFTFYELGPNNGVAAFTTDAPSVTPVFASLGVKYHTMKDSIKITSTSYGAKIYYTLDNSEPTSTNGTLYTAPFTVNTNGTVVKAATYGDLFKISAVGEYTVALPTTPAAVPVITNTGKRDYFTSVEKVAVASTETGAEIYYTLDGTDPNYKSTAYADTLLVSFGTTVKAIVYAPDKAPSTVASSTVAVVTDTTKPVAFSVPSGYHEGDFEVALTSATAGAKIYFTLDGTAPDYTDSLYTDTLMITPDAYAKRTVKAIAYADGFLPSKVDSVNYTFPINEKLNKPTFTVNYDYYNNVNLVVISAGDTAKAYYTTNGSTPTVSSTEFTDTLALSVNTKIKAIAYTPGYMPSDVDSVDAAMPVDTVKALVFTPEGGQFDADQTVTITTETEGAEIYYTLDGKAPSYNSTLYTAPVTVPLNTTLKAIAYAPAKVRSKSATAAYLHKQNPLYPVWGKSRNFGGYPSYFGSATERGMAYGKVDGKDRVYVISRRIASNPDILIYDAATGDSVGTLPTTGTGVGYFPLNSIDVSDDGIIFATNMTLDATGERPFIVYLWDNETSAPRKVIEYYGEWRMGDAFSVYGKASDNTLTIFAGKSTMDVLLKWKTTDNGATFTGEAITLENADVSTSPNAALVGDGTFYYKSFGRAGIHYAADGKVIDTVNTTALPTSVSKIVYHENAHGKYLLAYIPDSKGGTDGEKIAIVNLNDGDKNAYIEMISPSIGAVANANATGSVDFKKIDDENYIFYILGTNNGLAAFATSPELALAQYDTLFYGTSKNLPVATSGTGYISGTNSRGDLGKYQKFLVRQVADKIAPVELKGMKIDFAYAKVKDTPDTLNVVVRSIGANGAPDSLLASFTLTTDMIKLDEGNTFILNSPIDLFEGLFIGVEWKDTFNDTIAIYCDKDGEWESEAWEKLADSSYGSFDLASSWNLKADLWVYAYFKEGNPIGINDVENIIPEQYSLNQNYPNPFNPSTVISFSLRIESKVTLKVYNILGQEIASLVNGTLAAGSQAITFNASHLASGVYIYRLEVQGVDGSKFAGVKKMMFLK